MCNLASLNLSAFVDEVNRTYDFKRLYEVTKVVTRNLNKVIDVNFYPVIEVSLHSRGWGYQQLRAKRKENVLFYRRSPSKSIVHTYHSSLLPPSCIPSPLLYPSPAPTLLRYIVGKELKFPSPPYRYRSAGTRRCLCPHAPCLRMSRCHAAQQRCRPPILPPFPLNLSTNPSHSLLWTKISSSSYKPHVMSIWACNRKDGTQTFFTFSSPTSSFSPFHPSCPRLTPPFLLSVAPLAALEDIFETMYFASLEASMELAKVEGPYSTYEGSPMSRGVIQPGKLTTEDKPI